MKVNPMSCSDWPNHQVGVRNMSSAGTIDKLWQLLDINSNDDIACPSGDRNNIIEYCKCALGDPILLPRETASNVLS